MHGIIFCGSLSAKTAQNVLLIEPWKRQPLFYTRGIEPDQIHVMANTLMKMMHTAVGSIILGKVDLDSDPTVIKTFISTSLPWALTKAHNSKMH